MKAPHHRNPVIPLIDLLRFRHRYPFTHRWSDNFGRLAALSGDFIFKMVNDPPIYRTRRPDLSDRRQVGHDADAVYAVSVLDLVKFFRAEGFELLNVAAPRTDTPTSNLYTRLFPYSASIGLAARRTRATSGEQRAGPRQGRRDAVSEGRRLSVPCRSPRSDRE